MGQVIFDHLVEVNAATLGLCTEKQINAVVRQICKIQASLISLYGPLITCKLVSDFVFPQPVTGGGEEFVNDRSDYFALLVRSGLLACKVVPFRNFARRIAA